MFNILQKDIPPIAYLDSQGYEENGVYHHFLYADRVAYFNIYERGLGKASGLESFEAIIIPTSIDEIYLSKHATYIENFLENGKIVVSFAQNFLPWLPGNNLYIPSEIPIKDREVKISSHPIFQGVSQYDLNYRRGVKGFFNRGYFHPPKHAQIILEDSEGRCVAYIDRLTTKGVILSTAGADLLGFGIFDTNTARRMGVALLGWILKEIKGQK
ncbi:aspartate/tyrosine/aromatic aminotransferase [Helicobacter sp. 11S02596-1]|uniref:aspartate/tyrosine/aromatic aminotransferase n=1 Tax=Helicobacter sp. 11S02596-1 TaxID=1476194 RepID=UPI000BA639AA|nr:aspartate/tyrosine/aromatic aminotransferase [Helicobacter sp. 11S02596-1]PAF42380.1 hypothetical protein BJI48_07160 [Helicobacter sp. 11S02596-1]